MPDSREHALIRALETRLSDSQSVWQDPEVACPLTREVRILFLTALLRDLQGDYSATGQAIQEMCRFAHEHRLCNLVH